MKSSTKKRKLSDSKDSSQKLKEQKTTHELATLSYEVSLTEDFPSGGLNATEYSTFGYDSFFELINAGDPLEQLLAQSSIKYAHDEMPELVHEKCEDTISPQNDQTPPPTRKHRNRESETNKVKTRSSTQQKAKGKRYIQLDQTLLQGTSIYLKSPKEFEYFMGKLHPLPSNSKSPQTRASIYGNAIAAMVLGQYQHDELDPKVQVAISPELLHQKSTILIYHNGARKHISIFFLLFEYARKESDVLSVFTIIDYYLTQKRGVQGIKLPNLEGVQSSLGDMIKGYCTAVKWYPSELAEWFQKYDEDTHKILSKSIENHSSFKTPMYNPDPVALDAFFEKDERGLSHPFATLSTIPHSAQIMAMTSTTMLNTAVQNADEEDIKMTFKITPNGLLSDQPKNTQNILL